MSTARASAADGLAEAGREESIRFALERAFDACAPSLYRCFVVRTRDPHLADDLMQQLWLLAQRNAPSVPKAKLEPWLRVIAKNLLRSHWRMQRARGEPHSGAEPAAAALAARLTCEVLPTEELERQETRELLLAALTELESSDQELLISFYFNGEPQSTLAIRMGLTERAVEGRLYRARQALREKLRHLSPG